MAKPENKPEKLIPEIKESAKPQLLAENFSTVHLPGHYLLEMPDGTLTNVTPSVYRRAFENKEGITVKKSPNQ